MPPHLQCGGWVGDLSLCLYCLEQHRSEHTKEAQSHLCLGAVMEATSRLVPPAGTRLTLALTQNTSSLFTRPHADLGSHPNNTKQHF
mmetsp:Transcript_11003/g.40973  ORF Transcript_11003/g.40973 Transcript_11003/m.40973 type:complete len:87 (-) Transcript_11003:862-1122(-)